MNGPIHEINKVSGTVQRIYADSDGAFIKLKDPTWLNLVRSAGADSAEGFAEVGG